MRKIFFIIPLIAISIAIFVFIILRSNTGTTNQLPNLDNNPAKGSNTGTAQNPGSGGTIDSNGNSTNPGSSSGSGSSGGGSGSKSGPSQGPGISGCAVSDISYSLQDLKIEQTCNKYNGQVCIEKSVNCSIEIHNLESNQEGNFEIQTSFVEEGKETEPAIQTKTANFNIGPQEFIQYNESAIIYGSSENDPANKNIKCIYSSLEVPKKQLC